MIFFVLKFFLKRFGSFFCVFSIHNFSYLNYALFLFPCYFHCLFNLVDIYFFHFLLLNRCNLLFFSFYLFIIFKFFIFLYFDFIFFSYLKFLMLILKFCHIYFYQFHYFLIFHLIVL